jgi:hypothetical protein
LSGFFISSGLARLELTRDSQNRRERFCMTSNARNPQGEAQGRAEYKFAGSEFRMTSKARNPQGEAQDAPNKSRHLFQIKDRLIPAQVFFMANRLVYIHH